MKIKKTFDSELIFCEQINLDEKLKKIHDDPTYDGIIDVSKYCEAPLKILWILKEVNDNGGYNQRDALRNNVFLHNRKGWYPTLDPIIYISYAILNNFRTWKELSYITDDPEMIDVLKQIAYINIKKDAGGSFCSGNNLQQGYKKYKDILRLQIELANPDIIIGGNTLHLLWDDLGIKHNQIKAIDGADLGYFDQSDRLVLNAHHPNYYMRINENRRGEYFDAIIQTAKNWYINIS